MKRDCKFTMLARILRFQPALFLLLLLCAAPLWAVEPPFQLPPAQELKKLKTAKILTNQGEIVFQLFPESAPWHVANFKYLSDKGFYTKLPFHLFRQGYIIQGGSPDNKNPNAGPGYSLPPEFNDLQHLRGSLGMARYPDVINYSRRSHGSQFHILLRKAEHMDGSFTVFGSLLAGEQVLQRLEQNDKILGVEVYIAEEE